MKRLLAVLFAAIFAANLASCSKEPSKSEVISYVTDAIGESVSFFSSEKKDGISYYKFLLDDRQCTFDTVVKDGQIDIYYEKGIAEALADERNEISVVYGVRYDNGVIDVRDHEAAAAFICALDSLYSFREKIPERISHISGGVYDFGTSVAEGIAFSTNPGARIDTNTVLTYLAEFARFD